MEVQVQILLDTYKEEIARLANENILLIAQIKQLKQLQNELKKKEKEDESQQ